MIPSTDIAVIGAGPYGLSIGAHLHAEGADVRVIGHPMEMWQTQTPKGMLLKSDGFASNLHDPAGAFPLRRYCAEHNVPYRDLGVPVKATTFSEYGLEFQRRYVPTLERKKAVRIERAPRGFAVTLDSGEEFSARRVVLAVGINYFRYIPPEFSQLAPELVSHSADHHTVDRFKGRHVVVLGAGASATNLAVLLKEAGAAVRLIARRPALEIHTPMRLPRPWSDRLRSPLSPIGPSWRSRFYTDAPLLFHFLPEYKRLRTVANYLGPAAGWFMKERVIGQFPILLGHQPSRVKLLPNGRLELTLISDNGSIQLLETEHIACGTGFKVALDKMTCLSEALRAEIRSVENTPILSSRFESSVPGLYFAGPAAANSFGPMLRFACGAKFAARRIAPHLLRRRAAQSAGELPSSVPPRALVEEPSGG